MHVVYALILTGVGVTLLVAGLAFTIFGAQVHPIEPRIASLIGFAMLLTGVGFAAVGAGGVFGPKRKGATKESPYECGSPILQATRSKFDIRFFMLAMLFVLFDIETVLLVPYLIQYKTFGAEGLVIAAIFFAGLVESLAYAWEKGALDWYKPGSGMLKS